MDIKELLKVGLTEGEAKVYTELLKLGPSTVGPIVKRSGVAYSNIYEILNRLIHKGIVSYIIKSKTRHYQAASPNNILEYLEKKEAELKEKKKAFKELLPKLQEIDKITEKEEAEVFIGTKGLRTAYVRLIDKKKNSEMLFLYPHKKRYAKEADLFYFSILDLLSKVPIRGISNEFARESPWFKKQKIAQVKYVDFPFPSHVEICGDKMILVSWEKPLVTVLIHSKDIADNFKEYFESVWKKAKE